MGAKFNLEKKPPWKLLSDRHFQDDHYSSKARLQDKPKKREKKKRNINKNCNF